jgi:hypothetical protein
MTIQKLKPCPSAAKRISRSTNTCAAGSTSNVTIANISKQARATVSTQLTSRTRDTRPQWRLMPVLQRNKIGIRLIKDPHIGISRRD